MIDVVFAEISPTRSRMARIVVKYYDLEVCCEVSLYKSEKLWIRMPELWFGDGYKRRFVYWPDKEKSDEFQKEVLKKVVDMIGLDKEKALEIRKSLYDAKKANKQKKSSED